jgi:hypothetical protein
VSPSAAPECCKADLRSCVKAIRREWTECFKDVVFPSTLTVFSKEVTHHRRGNLFVESWKRRLLNLRLEFPYRSTQKRLRVDSRGEEKLFFSISMPINQVAIKPHSAMNLGIAAAPIAESLRRQPEVSNGSSMISNGYEVVQSCWSLSISTLDRSPRGLPLF